MHVHPLLFALIITVPLYSQNQADETCKDFSKIIELETSQASQKMHQRSNILTQGYDLKYHRLEWEVDPSVKYIKGVITSYFSAVEDHFQTIHFELTDNMQVNSVMYHGVSLTNELSNSDLKIELPEIVAVGKIDSITIIYEGKPESFGFGSFEIGNHNGVPMLWTLSEPYGAKTWWPCKQDLNDKIDSIDIIIQTPVGYRAATNGVLVSETKPTIMQDITGGTAILFPPI
ncbi:MAG: hypothetical protein IPL46_22955 [Saprospiraceae bacterium]|nr:hypothetical protein [Saprospiraceae bacterium]